MTIRVSQHTRRLPSRNGVKLIRPYNRRGEPSSRHLPEPALIPSGRFRFVDSGRRTKPYDERYLKYMDPVDVFRLAWGERDDRTNSEWLREHRDLIEQVAREEQSPRLRYRMRTGMPIDPPVVEFDAAGGYPRYDGAHRLAIAIELGIKKVPVLIIPEEMYAP